VSTSPVAYPQKRRSSRIEKAIPLAVQGIDASHAPYREEVTTGIISCHGCTYQMRHEVLPGDPVLLSMSVGPRAKSSESSRRARVKWIHKVDAAVDQPYQVAVEFEIAGNMWGIASAPEDWFPTQTAKPTEAANLGRELRLVTRTEPQIVLTRSEEAAPTVVLKRNQAAASLSPWFSDLMGGLSNQIQVTVSEIAAVTLAGERGRLLDEFRAQLQNEAAGTIERVIATANDELARRGLKALSEAAEATVSASHERLVGVIEQDLEDAKQRMLTQENEVSQRVAGVATSTIERVQRSLEVSRNEATERFVSRLREQVAPVLEEAKADLQKLVASQAAFKEESQAIYTRVTSQLEIDANDRVKQTHDELNRDSAGAVYACNEKLRELSQSFEKTARDSAGTVIGSVTDDAKKKLEERAAEISNDFTGQLEGHIRSYLEFIGESIAEFPKKTPDA